MPASTVPLAGAEKANTALPLLPVVTAVWGVNVMFAPAPDVGAVCENAGTAVAPKRIPVGWYFAVAVGEPIVRKSPAA